MSTSSFESESMSWSMLEALRLRGEEERCGASMEPPIIMRCCGTPINGEGLLARRDPGGWREDDGSGRNSSIRSLSPDKSAEAAQGELAAEEV